MKMLTIRALGDRTHGIGASEIAAVLGLHPTRTPVDVWLEKTGRTTYNGRLLDAGEPVAASGAATPVVVKEAPEMAWGRILEPAIVDWYARTMRVVFDPEFDGTRAARDPEFPNVWASPDRVAVAPRRTVEGKSVGWQMAYKWGSPGTDAVPVEYWLQVQLQTRCIGTTEDAHVVAAIAGRPPEVWVVPFDGMLARDLAERAQAWFDYYVDGGHEPPPHRPEDAAKLVRALMRKSMPRVAEVTPRLREAVEAVHDARSVRDEAEGLVSFHESRVKRIMGDCDSARDTDFSITWRTSASGSRPFRLTFKGDKE